MRPHTINNNFNEMTNKHCTLCLREINVDINDARTFMVMIIYSKLLH